jgi:hypothetical protein
VVLAHHVAAAVAGTLVVRAVSRLCTLLNAAERETAVVATLHEPVSDAHTHTSITRDRAHRQRWPSSSARPSSPCSCRAMRTASRWPTARACCAALTWRTRLGTRLRAHCRWGLCAHGARTCVTRSTRLTYAVLTVSRDTIAARIAVTRATINAGVCAHLHGAGAHANGHERIGVVDKLLLNTDVTEERAAHTHTPVAVCSTAVRAGMCLCQTSACRSDRRRDCPSS